MLFPCETRLAMLRATPTLRIKFCLDTIFLLTKKFHLLGFLSLMTLLDSAAFNLEEIYVQTSLVGSFPCCQFPNLSGDIFWNAACISGLLQEINLLRKAATPSKTGSPWMTLNPTGNCRKRCPGQGDRKTFPGYSSQNFFPCQMNCLKHLPFLRRMWPQIRHTPC